MKRNKSGKPLAKKNCVKRQLLAGHFSRRKRKSLDLGGTLSIGVGAGLAITRSKIKGEVTIYQTDLYNKGED